VNRVGRRLTRLFALALAGLALPAARPELAESLGRKLDAWLKGTGAKLPRLRAGVSR
jgi:hypothetical protein